MKYQATVLRVVDGDTFDAMVSLGFGVMVHVHCRLAHINCPELHGPDKYFAQIAASKTTELIQDKVVLLDGCKKDKNGRYLVSVELPDGQDLATILLTRGHGVPHEGHSEEENQSVPSYIVSIE